MLLKGRENHQLDPKALHGLFPHCSLSRPNPPSLTAATLNYLSHSFSAGYWLPKSCSYIMSPVPSCVPLTTQAHSANPTDGLWDLSVSAATLEPPVPLDWIKPSLTDSSSTLPWFHSTILICNATMWLITVMTHLPQGQEGPWGQGPHAKFFSTTETPAHDTEPTTAWTLDKCPLDKWTQVNSSVQWHSARS